MSAVDATILIPTHDHASVLPIAIRSALVQRDATVEVFVVGDGVRDATRRVIRDLDSDAPVRFFDFPKGERHGERYRHDVLQTTSGSIICYLSDDDILMPWHVAEMRRLLSNADFAHSAPVLVDPDGVLMYRPADLARPEFLSLILRGVNNFISLTGAAHTRALYDRLPHGWRPAPTGVGTDIHMWRQVFALPDVRGVTSTKLTSIHFPNPTWRDTPESERASAIERWLERALAPGGEQELDGALDDAARRVAQDLKLRSIELNERLSAMTQELARLREPAWRRLGRSLLRAPGAGRLRVRLRGPVPPSRP